MPTLGCVKMARLLACSAGLCSPRHLAVPVRLPAPLLPRPTPQPHRHHCDRHQAAAPLSCMRQQAQRCKGHSSGAAAPGQDRGQSRGLLGPAVPRRGAREGTKASRQGQEAKVARKGSNGCRALIVTRQQEEAWQTRLLSYPGLVHNYDDKQGALSQALCFVTTCRVSCTKCFTAAAIVVLTEYRINIRLML